MRVTKRVFQRRRNNFIALLIVINILVSLYYICYLIWLPLIILSLWFSIIIMYNFPWYKFK